MLAEALGGRQLNSLVEWAPNGNGEHSLPGLILPGNHLGLDGDITAGTLKIPSKIRSGTVIPGLINAATWRDQKTGGVYIFGRQMLGRGDGVPDPSNSILISCDSQGNVLREKVVAKPNEKGEQYEDWRANRTNRGTVILSATRTKKIADREFKAEGVWMEVQSAWDGTLGEVRDMPEADFGKNGTPYLGGNRMLFRRDESPHILDDYVIKGDRLQYAGEVQVPGYVREKFIKCGTTFAPEIGANGDGVGMFHFQELMPDGSIAYSLRRAVLHLNGRLSVQSVDLENAITKGSFKGFDIPELRKDIPIEVVYQTGEGCYNVADKATVVTHLPR